MTIFTLEKFFLIWAKSSLSILFSIYFLSCLVLNLSIVVCFSNVNIFPFSIVRSFLFSISFSIQELFFYSYQYFCIAITSYRFPFYQRCFRIKAKRRRRFYFFAYLDQQLYFSVSLFYICSVYLTTIQGSIVLVFDVDYIITFIIQTFSIQMMMRFYDMPYTTCSRLYISQVHVEMMI